LSFGYTSQKAHFSQIAHVDGALAKEIATHVAAADAAKTAASKVEQAESLGEDPLAFVKGEQQEKA